MSVPVFYHWLRLGMRKKLPQNEPIVLSHKKWVPHFGVWVPHIELSDKKWVPHLHLMRLFPPSSHTDLLQMCRLRGFYRFSHESKLVSPLPPCFILSIQNCVSSCKHSMSWDIGALRHVKIKFALEGLHFSLLEFQNCIPWCVIAIPVLYLCICVFENFRATFHDVSQPNRKPSPSWQIGPYSAEINLSEYISNLSVPEHIWIYLNTSEYISHMDVPEYIWIHLNTSHIWMCLNISELYWSVTAIQSNLLPIVRSGTTLYPQTILCLTVT